MLDFPNAPTLNQIFTSAGTSWQWDGFKWVSLGSSATYVLKAGDVMTGLLTLSGAPTANLHAATKLYVDTADALRLPLTGGVLSGPGNLALGGATIPSPVAGPSILAGVYQILTAPGSNWMFLLNNIYSDGSNFRAVQTGTSAYLQLTNNALYFYTAASVAAGAIPSPAAALTVANNGLAIGNTTLPSSAASGALYGVTQIASQSTSGILYLSNSYYDGSNYRYQVTNPANVLLQGLAGLIFYTAPSGSAGAVATMTQKFQIDLNGSALLGGLVTPFPAPVGPFINAYQFLGTTLASVQFAHNLYYDGTNWRLYGAAAGTTIQLSSGALYIYNAPSGAAGSIPTMTQRFSVDANGNVTAGGSLNATTTIGAGGGTVLSRDATWTYFNDPSGGTALYLGNSAQNTNYYGNGIHSFSSRGLATMYAQFASGGTYNTSGAWIAFSDIRTKTDIEDYTAGLDAICALRPVTYRRNGRAQLPVLERKHLGFVAHEVEPIMPEIVLHEMARLDPDDEELTELLATESHNVIYAMVNAIRELRDQIAELKAAHA